MALNEQELMEAYHGLMQAYPEDLHIARPLIQMLQARGEEDDARELALKMSRRMLALGYSSYALAFLNICEQLGYDDMQEIAAIRNMAELTLATETHALDDAGQIFKLIEELSDMESKDFLKQGTLLHVAEGTHVVKQDETSESFYLILEGEMNVHMIAHDGNHVDLVVLKKGSFFGEVACLYHLPRTATVTASSDATLLTFSGEAVASLIETSPVAGAGLMRVVKRRMMESVAFTHHAFREVETEDREWVEDETELLEFKAGEMLAAPDHHDKHFFYILTFGLAELSRTVNGQTITKPFALDEMYGDVMPLMSLPGHTSITALERCLVCKIPAEIFDAFYNAYGTFGHWVERHANRRNESLEA